ncbi:hypothetical protein IWQ62_001347 [Dispira parvispora]|uniref:PhoD-like phosphatase domain-containing protein n=1 Tax=Dispira parvispora TaxID=1520584 RepID=A0A9W8ASI3_9FUNG|nr:hypothetical protein IWQ62_001347 [Dispira parvispora]
MAMPGASDGSGYGPSGGGYPQAQVYPPPYPPPPVPSGANNNGHPPVTGYGDAPSNQPPYYPPPPGPGYNNYPSAPSSNAPSAYPPPLPPKPQSSAASGYGYSSEYSAPPSSNYPPRPPGIVTSSSSYNSLSSGSTGMGSYPNGPLSANPSYRPPSGPLQGSITYHGGMAQAMSGNVPNIPGMMPKFPREGVNGFHGPLLRFGDMNFRNKTFSGSVMVISTSGYDSQSPTLNFVDQGAPQPPIEGEAIDRYLNNTFWRFPFRLQLTEHERTVNYSINNGVQYSFTLPSATQPWRWMFYSCNGFSESIKDPQAEFGGPNPLWDDFLAKHARRPFHVMVGGGDQLYCDGVWKLPELAPFLKNKEKKKRKVLPLSPQMQHAVEQFYFEHYVYVFLYESSFRHAVSSVPYAMMIDDHDIFDGFGSYPEYLQNSHVFRGIGSIALRFYLLFQQHTTVTLANHHQLFGSGGFSWLKHLGSTTALLGMDTRFERTLEQVVTPASYDMIFQNLQNHLSNDCRHLVVVLGVPIVYPRLTAAEGALSALANTAVGSILVKSGAVSSQLNEFGEPELLDDLNDHWTAKIHMDERATLVQRLQQFAQSRSIRVTFLSGDVHCCGAGKFHTKPKKDVTLPHNRDHRLMYQVISSAIMNAPPPLALLRTLHVTSSTNVFDKVTEERMVELFERDVDDTNLVNRKLMGRRNYCTASFDNGTGDLVFNINVETVDHTSTVPYQINVPLLVSGSSFY